MIYKEIPLVDGNRLKELSMMDDEGNFVRELVELFVTDSSASITEIQHSLGMNDLTNVRRVAHRLKGSALSIGADRFAALASDIENEEQVLSMNESATRLTTLREETITELMMHCS